MSRHCSCCGVVGHTVSRCNDASAMSAMQDLLRDESIASAMGKVESYPSNIVSFILCRGFGAPIAGKRQALRNHVLAKFPEADASAWRQTNPDRVGRESREVQQQRLEEQRRETVRVERLSPERRIRAMQRMTNTQQIQNAAVQEDVNRSLTQLNILRIISDAFNYTTPGLVTLLPTHPYYDYYLGANHLVVASDTMKVVVKQVLELMYEESRRSAISTSQMTSNTNIISPHQLEINRRFQQLLDDGERYYQILQVYTIRCHMQFSPLAITQMLRLSRIYNYKRVSERLLRFDFIETHVQQVNNNASAAVMKPLAIHVVLELDEEEEEEKAECSVCFEELSREKMVKTGCNHVFCSECVAGVAKTRGIKSFIRCPCCRADIDQLTVGCHEEHAEIIKGLAPVAI